VSEPAETRPRRLHMIHLPKSGAIIVEADRASTYFADPEHAWQCAWRLVDPRINVPPQGNC
jgi:hypothetical protein